MLNFIQNFLGFLLSIFKNFLFKKKIFYIVEYKKWANFNDAINLKKFFKSKFIISHEIYGIRQSIIHIGTHYKLFKKDQTINIHKSNKLIVFWPHLNKKSYISKFLKNNIDKIFKINTCSIDTKKKLIKYGIPKNKLIYTPLAIDTKIFRDFNINRKKKLREKYLIPKNKLILGSFVKDGVGFEHGWSAKNLKNPQMLIKSLKNIPNKKDLFVVLSGPARGYIKKELGKIGIEFFHKNCSSAKDLAELYNLVDVTIINSNIEGGPYSLLESLASGVPVISTKVGMSPEIIKNGHNGFLIKINNHQSLTKKIKYFLTNYKKDLSFKSNSRKSIIPYSIKENGRNFDNKVYKLS